MKYIRLQLNCYEFFLIDYYVFESPWYNILVIIFVNREMVSK